MKRNHVGAYLGLVLGSGLTYFIGMQRNVPLAAWLAPVFLIRFFRSRETWWETLIAVPFLGLSGFLKMHGGWDLTIWGEIGFGLLISLPLLFSLYLDRAQRRRNSLAATLVFPAAYTTLEYLFSLTPIGSSLSLAVTQFDALPLIQIVSLTGIWGIPFLTGWFAVTVNILWEQAFDLKRVAKPVIAFTTVLMAVLLYGGLRLAVLRPESSTVRIGAITVAQPTDYWAEIIDQKTPEEVAHRYDQEYAVIRNQLFDESKRAAGLGANVIFWSEANLPLHPDQEAVFLESARAFAREHDVYFVPAVLVFDYGEVYAENKLVMITPDGEIAYQYEKTKSWYETHSDDQLRYVETPYGRIATAICFDMDFPAFIRQLSPAHIDIMLAPAFDWEPIKSFHTQVGLLRGIENGFSVVRQTNQGTSMAINHLGRLLAYQDYFTTENPVMMVDLPTAGIQTPYGFLGDWLAYLSILFSAGVIFLQSVKR
ncbi:MAG: hypothetical protein JXB35_00980 [Anaerolineae bacterium]|nr:hypothetical protein [Anaerolineae bacterium]